MSYTLYHGEALTLLRTLPDASVDAIIADEPYSSGGTSSRERTSRSPREKYQTTGTQRTYPTFYGEHRDQRSFAYWCALWLSECLRIARPGAPICMFTDWRQLPSATDALQAGGWLWQGIVPWTKPSARPHVGRFTNQCEYIVWGSNGPLGERPGIGVLAGFITAAVIAKEKHHLTGKPLAVMEHLVKICAPGGTILDPFAGSGSTGVAALRQGYSFIGIEQSADYIPIAQARLEAAGKQLPSC